MPTPRAPDFAQGHIKRWHTLDGAVVADTGPSAPGVNYYAKDLEARQVHDPVGLATALISAHESLPRTEGERSRGSKSAHILDPAPDNADFITVTDGDGRGWLIHREDADPEHRFLTYRLAAAWFGNQPAQTPSKPVCEDHDEVKDLVSMSPDGSGYDWLCWSCWHRDHPKEPTSAG